MKTLAFLILLIPAITFAAAYQIPGAVIMDGDIAWTCLPIKMLDGETSVKCAPNRKRDFCFLAATSDGSMKCRFTGEIES